MTPGDLARAALAAGIALLSSGCLFVSASGSFGPALDAAKIARIEPGVTTKRELLEWFGPPEEFVRSEVIESLADDVTRVNGAIALGNRAQDAFTWQHDTIDGSGTALVFYNQFSARIESELLVVFFDGEDRVREFSVRRSGASR